jgi:hypothetical protein
MPTIGFVEKFREEFEARLRENVVPVTSPDQLIAIR